MPNRTVIGTSGILYYDGSCGFCRRGIRRIRKPLASIEVEVRPFEKGAEEPEMILEWRDGQILGGPDAAIFLARRFPLLFLPATVAAWVPFIYLVRAVYKIIARRRHCLGKSACELDFAAPTEPRTAPGWLITLGLVATAVAGGVGFHLTGWIWMWLIAFAMWFGFKIMSFRRGGSFPEIDPFYFLWPGMDPGEFAYDQKGRGETIPLAGASCFVLLGMLLLAILPGITSSVAAGWTGVFAMLCLLHFGTFSWMATFWNRLGFPATPIMRRPWKSVGLGDFWGNRWNRAYSNWAREFLFAPLTARFGPAAGTMAGFLASGIAHELVISVPARAGYGLPTLYFLIQAAGLLVEKRIGLRKRKLARIWLWIVALVPAPLLFHTPFIENVFNPMTKEIMALWTR